MHEDNQIIFIDTPGIHQTEKLLNKFMLDEALKAMGDCDLILFLAPITDSLKYYEDFLEKNRQNTKHILLLTKIDFINNDELIQKLKEYEKYNNKYEAIIPVSIKRATKKADVLDELIKYLPKHPYLFDQDIMTTQNLRDIYKEFIREAIFENISDEIPYETDVIVNKVEEKPNVDVIKATIVVQKDTQKGMIIGKSATAIKRIGKSARVKIEKLTSKKCFLELFVSVKKNWTKNKEALKSLDYKIDN